MPQQTKLFLGLTMVCILSSLGFTIDGVDERAFDPEKVAKVELIKVDPEDQKDEIASFEIPEENKAAFLGEFMKVKSVIDITMGKCFKFRIYLKDGGKRTFLTDGKYFYRYGLGHYQFLSNKNVILKYWDFSSRDLCKVKEP